MKLYLVQHGEAVSKQDDPERPLSEQGLQDVQAMAEIYFKRGMNKKAGKQVVEFIKRERDGALSAYVTGTANEDNFKHILPYKTMVMRELVRVYEKTGSALGDKTKALSEKITEMKQNSF